MKITMGGFPEDADGTSEKYKEVWEHLEKMPVDTKTGIATQWLAVRNLEKAEARLMQSAFGGKDNGRIFYCVTRVRVSEVQGDETFVLWLRKIAAK